MGYATYQVLQPAGCVVGSLLRRGPRPSRNDASVRLEYTKYVEGVMQTWHDAIERLEEDAVRAGAHGVIGVTASESTIRAQAGSVQVQLTGSAVFVKGIRPLRRPFLSMLSMDETMKLLLRGWIPCGVGVGVAAMHVHGTDASAFWRYKTVFGNVELEVPTRIVNSARHRAVARLRASGTFGGAETVIGTNLTLTHTPEPCFYQEGLLVTARVTGTGVARFGPPVQPIDRAFALRARET